MALAAGSIAFTGFNADGQDNLAFVVLDDIAAGAQIFFSDQTWDGSAFGTTETFWTWTATAAVAAGTIVTLDNFFGGTLTANVGSVAFTDATGRGLSATAETIYAYLGAPTVPTTFLAAIASKNFDSTANGGVLAGTGLVEGDTALSLNQNGGVDIGAYAGPRSGLASFAAYRTQINNPANWATQDAVGDQSADGTSPDLPFSTTALTVCFAAGTGIAAPDGEIQVEALSAGDRVMAWRNGTWRAESVAWVGRRTLDLRRHPDRHRAAPVRICRDALADGMPHRDLVLSPDHAVLVDGALVVARRLVNGATIRRDMTASDVTYLHVELADHAILLSEGLMTESYLDTGNRGFFSNGGTTTILHPDFNDPAMERDRQTRSCAPFHTDDSVHRVWRRVAERAGVVDKIATPEAMTDDPDARLIHSGGVIRPLQGASGTLIFPLPPGLCRARLLSRSASPTDLRPWVGDDRCLGVRIAAISLHDGGSVQPLPLDHPALTDGWWPVERDGTAMRRWTNGDAAMCLPPVDRPTLLHIRLGGAIRYRVAAASARHVA